jgi:hypothetical protein
MARNTLAPGGYIGGEPPRRPYLNQLSGVWKLEDAVERQKAGTWTNPLGIEDLFSTYLYTGNGSTQTITNGIDLAGKGGLVWIKSRSTVTDNALFDTARGASNGFLRSNTTDTPYANPSSDLTSFDASGFSITNSTGNVNVSPRTYASWTFRKAAKFFDVVTWTGDGASSRNISHALGSTPGFIVVKRTSASSDWWCWHRSISTGDLSGNNLIVLNTTAAQTNIGTVIGTASSTSFQVGGDSSVNASGATYVAYLFAHDAGGFGDSGNDSVVSCGTFTGDSTVTLGWEPQWLLFKRTDSTGNWRILDNMRGMPVIASSTGSQQVLFPNTSGAESTDGVASPTPTGFQAFLGAGTYIYIAIRRGPMKTPTDATKVFSPYIAAGNTATGFVTDLQFALERAGSANNAQTYDRLRGGKTLRTSSTGAEFNFDVGFATNDGTTYSWTSGYLRYSFRRAPGFFDVVAYTGTGSDQTITHNLGVTPELIIVKCRSAVDDWYVYSQSLPTATQNWVRLSTNASANGAIGQDLWGPPTSTTFKVDTYLALSTSAGTYIAYLFASCPGVSKVGSYTGTGTTLSIDCGFTAGARFVLIKRTDSTGDWYVWDTARGIISGNDPSLLLNSTAAEVTNTDYIDPLNAGFQISSTAPAAINANGGSFIFFAVA